MLHPLCILMSPCFPLQNVNSLNINSLEKVYSYTTHNNKCDTQCGERKSTKGIFPIVNIETKTSFEAAMHTNRDLVFIPGQRGKNLLLYQNYTYSKNNSSGNTSYWKCRIVKNGKPCNARITTFFRANGLYNVCLTKPEHSHPPSTRYFKRNKRQIDSKFYK